MQANFIDTETNEKYTIGSVGFNFLDKNSVFDEYQEDNDIFSEVIFLTSKCNVIDLAETIRKTVVDAGLRDDIKSKLLELSSFIRTSNGIKVLID